LGPMLLIEFVKDRATKEPALNETPLIVTEALKHGVMTIRAGLYSNCLRFLPPLNITDEQLDEGMNVIAEAIRVVEGQLLPQA